MWAAMRRAARQCILPAPAVGRNAPEHSAFERLNVQTFERWRLTRYEQVDFENELHLSGLQRHHPHRSAGGGGDGTVSHRRFRQPVVDPRRRAQGEGGAGGGPRAGVRLSRLPAVRGRDHLRRLRVEQPRHSRPRRGPWRWPRHHLGGRASGGARGGAGAGDRGQDQPHHRRRRSFRSGRFRSRGGRAARRHGAGVADAGQQRGRHPATGGGGRCALPRARRDRPHRCGAGGRQGAGGRRRSRRRSALGRRPQALCAQGDRGSLHSRRLEDRAADPGRRPRERPSCGHRERPPRGWPGESLRAGAARGRVGAGEVGRPAGSSSCQAAGEPCRSG